MRGRTEGKSLQRIATALTEVGVPTKNGGTWHAVTVQNVLRIHPEQVIKTAGRDLHTV